MKSLRPWLVVLLSAMVICLGTMLSASSRQVQKLQMENSQLRDFNSGLIRYSRKAFTLLGKEMQQQMKELAPELPEAESGESPASPLKKMKF